MVAGGEEMARRDAKRRGEKDTRGKAPNSRKPRKAHQNIRVNE